MSINAVHVTAARWRFLLNVKGYGGAAARDGGRYCDTRLRFCTAGPYREVEIRSWCRVTCLRAVGASLVTVRSQAHSRRREAESHGEPTAGKEG